MLNVWDDIRRLKRRARDQRKTKSGQAAQAAMEACKKPHTFNAHEDCEPCSVYVQVLNRSEYREWDVGCRMDPEGTNWAAIQHHVFRAKIREHWFTDGLPTGAEPPSALLHAVSEAQIEWVLALMYLLGWTRPQWAKDWEWM